MTWVRLDEEFPDHPKVAAAGPLACWLHVCALAYCNRYLTDGFVPAGQVPKLADFTAVKARPADLAERLVDVGMWEREANGFRIHDFHDYQPTKAQVESERLAKSAAGRKGAANRWGGRSKAPPMAEGMAPPMTGAMGGAMADEMAGAMAPPMAERWPVPVPVPETPSSSSDSRPPPTRLDDDDGSLDPVTEAAVAAAVEAELADRLSAVVVTKKGQVRDVEAWRRGSRERALARLAEGGMAALTPPPPTTNGDPLERSAVAQRSLVERNEARMRGESACERCADAGVFEDETGSVSRCDCVAEPARKSSAR